MVMINSEFSIYMYNLGYFSSVYNFMFLQTTLINLVSSAKFIHLLFFYSPDYSPAFLDNFCIV